MPSFMSQFKLKRYDKENYDNGGSLSKFQVVRKDKQTVSLADVKKLTLHYGNKAAQANDDVHIAIRGMAIDGWKTLKAFENSILTEAEYDDYYVNKVRDTTKYHSFPQLQLYIEKN